MRADSEAQRRVDAYECLNRSVVDKQNGCLGDCALVLLCYTTIGISPPASSNPIKHCDCCFIIFLPAFPGLVLGYNRRNLQ